MPKPNPAGVLRYLYWLTGAGTVLLRIPIRTKGPTGEKWQKTTFSETQVSWYQHKLLLAAKHGGNIGVLLGSASAHLVAIDIDTDLEIENFFSLNPSLRETLCSRGGKGCQVWLRIGGYYPERRITSGLKFPNSKKSAAEWRGGGGHQSVIWGLHKDTGQPYQRIVNRPVKTITFEEIKWPETWQMSFEDKAAATPSFSTGNQSSGPVVAVTPRLERRILAYLAAVPPAISGSGGHTQTLIVATEVVQGFSLHPESALQFLRIYNQKCQPPWEDKDLRRKINEALKNPHPRPRGYLL